MYIRLPFKCFSTKQVSKKPPQKDVNMVNSWAKNKSMLKNRDEILITLHRNKDTIKRFGVKRLSLFGSFARGEEKTASDLDFLVEFDRKSFDAYMDFKEYLESLFHCHVDLVLTSAVKPRLRSRILKEAVHAAGL